MATQDQLRPHLSPPDTRTTEGYTAHGGGGGRADVPPQPRAQHAAALRAQFAEVAAIEEQRVGEQKAANIQTAIGVQVEFESEHAVALATESLARDRQGIELLNVRMADDQVMATVFVPEGKLAHFEKLLVDYEAHRVDAALRARDNQPLIDAIRAVRIATFTSLWTDTDDALPVNDEESIWWEAWLLASNNREQVIADFRSVAAMAGLVVSERVLYFPERSVLLVHGTKAQLIQSTLVLSLLAELRRAKTTAEFFDALPFDEQVAWVDELQERIVDEHGGNSYVTLLDTGVNHGHPLLNALVADADRHTIEPAWGADDQNGHGTELAGLALFGELSVALQDGAAIQVPHRLESVKVLRGQGDNEGQSYGAITAEAVARVEIVAPDRRRVYAMAVSSTDGRDRGRPSSWSSAIDRLACDYDGQGASPRLFVLCAGNTYDQTAWPVYPASLSTSSIHDPGQAWNAVTVGAYSDLTAITEANAQHYTAIAPAGGLSPYTTTSGTWQETWPFKPDIVMEGGNVAIDQPTGFVSSLSSLSLLTTGHRPHERLFTVSWATSAASALAARMAAHIQAAYPDFWPETVRG